MNDHKTHLFAMCDQETSGKRAVRMGIVDVTKYKPLVLFLHCVGC